MTRLDQLRQDLACIAGTVRRLARSAALKQGTRGMALVRLPLPYVRTGTGPAVAAAPLIAAWRDRPAQPGA